MISRKNSGRRKGIALKIISGWQTESTLPVQKACAAWVRAMRATERNRAKLDRTLDTRVRIGDPLFPSRIDERIARRPHCGDGRQHARADFLSRNPTIPLSSRRLAPVKQKSRGLVTAVFLDSDRQECNFRRLSGVAQLAERVAVNHHVGGPNPSTGARRGTMTVLLKSCARCTGLQPLGAQAVGFRIAESRVANADRYENDARRTTFTARNRRASALYVTTAFAAFPPHVGGSFLPYRAVSHLRWGF